MTSYRTASVLGLAGLAILAAIAPPGCSQGADSAQRTPIGATDTAGACGSDQDCPLSEYCRLDGRCGSDCSGDVGCSEGEVCTTRGLCVLADGGTSPGIDVDGASPPQPDGDDQDVCVDVQVELTQQIPTVVLLVDQSWSMNLAFDGSKTEFANSRWVLLRSALIEPGVGLVPRLEDAVRFGLALYTSKNGGANCPILTGVDVALGNAAAISDIYLAQIPVDDTPTGESVRAVADALAVLDVEGPKVILLATDGEPDTCKDPNSSGDVPRGLTLDAVRDAYAAGIATYVVSVGKDIGEEHLLQVANLGQGYPLGDPTVRYYTTTSKTELGDALTAITDQVRSCAFSLNGEVVEGKEAEGRVLLNGEPLGYQAADGWRLNGRSELELLGASCEAIKHGNHALDITFPCETFTLIVR